MSTDPVVLTSYTCITTGYLVSPLCIMKDNKLGRGKGTARRRAAHRTGTVATAGNVNRSSDSQRSVQKPSKYVRLSKCSAMDPKCPLTSTSLEVSLYDSPEPQWFLPREPESCRVDYIFCLKGRDRETCSISVKFSFITVHVLLWVP